MTSDDFRKAWQAHASQTRVSVDADLLLQQVQRNQQGLRSAISSEDSGITGILLLLVPVWIYLGISTESPWTWYLMVPALIWIVGYVAVYRQRHRYVPSDPAEPLVACIHESLNLVEQQISLTRSILWWYILPMAVPLLVSMIHGSWLKAENWQDALFDANVFVIIEILVVFWFVYYLNQRVVKTQYEPRRQELRALLADLDANDDSDRAGVERFTTYAQSHHAVCERPRWATGVFWCIFVSMCIAASITAFYTDTGSVAPHPTQGQGYPRLSPFNAIRWQHRTPEVRVNQQWYELISLNDLPAADIVEFSRQNNGQQWQKRFEEDLVELLSQMGHPPQKEVTLVVRAAGTAEVQILSGVPMTADNRQAIKAAADSPGKVNAE